MGGGLARGEKGTPLSAFVSVAFVLIRNFALLTWFFEMAFIFSSNFGMLVELAEVRPSDSMLTSLAAAFSRIRSILIKYGDLLKLREVGVL